MSVVGGPVDVPMSVVPVPVPPSAVAVATLPIHISGQLVQAQVGSLGILENLESAKFEPQLCL